MTRILSSKRISILTIILVMLSSMLAPATAYAYEAMDMTRNGNCSLTIQLPAPSDGVKLYFVADMDDQTKITMKEEYAGLGVTLDDVESTDDWAKKAEVLSTQLIGSSIEPMVASTGEDNKASFESLSFGIYLVVVDSCEDGTNKYTITPNFISVPNSTDGNTWIYDVNATLKYEAQPTPTPGPEKIKFAVRKTWMKDGTGTNTRPNEVIVKILKSYKGSADDAEATESSLSAGKEPGWQEVETVSLNAGNGWYYTWEAEADGAEWKVQEVTALSQYTVEYSNPVEGETKVFTIVNSYLTPTPTKKAPTPTPGRNVTPTQRSYKATATPRPNVTTTIRHSTPKTGDDQNILLPVIGVLAAGLVLVLLGMNIRKKSGKDE